MTTILETPFGSLLTLPDELASQGRRILSVKPLPNGHYEIVVEEKELHSEGNVVDSLRSVDLGRPAGNKNATSES